MNDDDRAKHLHFMAHVAEALTRTAAIIKEREEVYNTDAPIQDLIKTPLRAFQLTEYKMDRVKVQLNRWVSYKGKPEDKDPLQDSILDAIAYLTFLYAWTEENNGDQHG